MAVSQARTSHIDEAFHILTIQDDVRQTGVSVRDDDILVFRPGPEKLGENVSSAPPLPFGVEVGLIDGSGSHPFAGEAQGDGKRQVKRALTDRQGMEFAQGAGQQVGDALRVEHGIRVTHRDTEQTGEGQVFMGGRDLVTHHHGYRHAAPQPAQPLPLLKQGADREATSPLHLHHVVLAAPHACAAASLGHRLPAGSGQHAAQGFGQAQTLGGHSGRIRLGLGAPGTLLPQRPFFPCRLPA